MTRNILNFVEIYYSNHFIPIPEDLKSKIASLEQGLEVDYNNADNDILMEEIINRISTDLKMTYQMADDYFSKVFDYE